MKRTRSRVRRIHVALFVLGGLVAVPRTFACDPLSDEDVAALAALSQTPAPTPAPGLSTTALAEILRKHGLADDADAVSAYPGTVEETSPDFLAGGSLVKVTLDGPIHSDVLRFVHQGGRWVLVPHGPGGERVIANEVRAALHDPDAALAYVRWVLDATAEDAIWLVSSAGDVPLLRAGRGEEVRREELAAVDRDLRSKITAPRAEASGNSFVVVQDAVIGRNLVRTTAKVSKLGLATFTHETIARDLPVVAAASFR